MYPPCVQATLSPALGADKRHQYSTAEMWPISLLTKKAQPPPFPYLQLVIIFNSAVYVLHTYLDIRQLRVCHSVMISPELVPQLEAIGSSVSQEVSADMLSPTAFVFVVCLFRRGRFCVDGGHDLQISLRSVHL